MRAVLYESWGGPEVLKVADLAYLPKEKRFAAIANRFDWVIALEEGNDRPDALARRLAALRFERVLSAKVSGSSAVSGQAYAEIMGLLASGVLKPVIDSRYPFDKIVEAHRRVDGGHKAGSVVVTVG